MTPGLTSLRQQVQALPMTRPTTPSPGDRPRPRTSPRHWLEDRLTGALLGIARALPYRWRIPAFGWLGAYVIGPLAGMRQRVRANLALVFPDMPAREVRRLSHAVPGNLTRALAETFSGDAFIAQVRNSPVEGNGLPALEAARKSRRPVVVVTAHLGNYDVARVTLRERGFLIVGLYMPMQNPAFNARYVAAMSHIGPAYPRDRAGLAELLRHLRAGGMIGLVADHFMSRGELIDFMGQPARTSTAPAEMALKYDALLVPVYGIRNRDGLTFRVRIESPIPHSDPLTMTRALNASLEAAVRDHMDQWMWTHRRWKRNKPEGSA